MARERRQQERAPLFAQRLTAIAGGATALYNCANPPYHRWSTDWPSLAAALLTAAERSGAVLVTMANLYGYGPVDAPMSEDTPLRSAPGTKETSATGCGSTRWRHTRQGAPV